MKIEGGGVCGKTMEVLIHMYARKVKVQSIVSLADDPNYHAIRLRERIQYLFAHTCRGKQERFADQRVSIVDPL